MKIRQASRLLLPLLFLLALPASADATWTAPVTLSDAGANAYASHVGVDQLGNAVFVWGRYDGSTSCNASYGCFRVQTRARSAAGVLSPVQTLSNAGKDASVPDIAVDQNGNAFFVWALRDATTDCGGSGCLRIQLRTRSATGTLSPVQILSGAGQIAFDPKVAVDQNDNAVVVWSRYDGTSSSCCSRIQTRTRSAAGALSTLQTLSTAGTADSPRVGVDQSGNAVFVWRRDVPCGTSACERIQTRVRSADGTLSALQNLSDPMPGGSYPSSLATPKVGVDQSGDAVFTWARRDATTDCSGGPCYRIQGIARAATGSLSTVQTLSDPGQHAIQPRIAVDQSGNAVFAWTRNDGSTGCTFHNGCLLLQTVFRSAAGTLSAVQTLSVSGQGAFAPEVGIDQSDRAVFVWQGGGAAPNTRIKSRSRTANGTLSAIQIVSGTNVNKTAPDLAVNSSGNAVASWNSLDASTDCNGGYSCERIDAAAGP